VIAHIPDFMSNSGGSVKERIALKCLEEWLDPQMPCPPLPPRIPESLLASGSALQIDPNRLAVEVLFLLLDKVLYTPRGLSPLVLFQFQFNFSACGVTHIVRGE